MSLSFICPRCRAHLKVRNESFVGQTLDCPECRAPLLVISAGIGEVAAQEIVSDKPALQPAITNKPEKSTGAANEPGTTVLPDSSEVFNQPFPGFGSGSRIPQIVAWSVAAVCLLGLIPFLLPSPKQNSDTEDLPAPTVAQTDSSKADNTTAGTVAVAKVEEKEVPLPATPEGRLAHLGKLVLDRAEQEGHFPAGTIDSGGLPVAHRWSWHAQIAVRRDNPQATPIDWNQRWNDPSTDHFVRRPIPRFQNPLVESQTSEDKYPAAHFVGVAGVGTDAAMLPVDHPRAGIFGQDRKTRREDIRDGASNTMLLAGVEEQLGSWADGATSYRAFTREPYVHGPDGFGTWQPNSMFVLMADGSVKEISSDIDPTVVRRMAAMNDGLPLDPQVPGEPSDPKPATKPPMPETRVGPPVQVAVIPPDERPMPQTPIVKPASEIKIDIPAALARKILSFDQTKPAAAYQLLLQIEELSGIRIEYDRDKLGAAADRLDKPITLKMQNATLEELLSEILRQIDLKRQDEKSRIRIVLPS